MPSTAAANVVTSASTTAATSVVPPSVPFLVVSTARVLWLGLLCFGVAVVCSSGAAVTSRMAVLVQREVGSAVVSLRAVDG